MKEKIIVAILLIMIVVLLYLAYRPLSINTVHKGLYYDIINTQATEQIDVSIVGIVKKSLFLQPESFAGTISVNSSKFEIIKPIQFDKVRDTIRLTLSKDIVDTMWILHDESNLFGHYNGLLSWSVYLDKNLSIITLKYCRAILNFYS